MEVCAGSASWHPLNASVVLSPISYSCCGLSLPVASPLSVDVLQLQAPSPTIFDPQPSSQNLYLGFTDNWGPGSQKEETKDGLPPSGCSLNGYITEMVNTAYVIYLNSAVISVSPRTPTPVVSS